VHISSYPALSPAGDLLAVGSNEGQLPEVSLYELPSFRQRWRRALPASTVQTVEFTPQADRLIVAGETAFVATCNVSDGTIRLSLDARQPARITVSPNDQLLAAGYADHAIRIWDSETGMELVCLQGHDGAVQALTFSPDGQTLAAGSSTGSVTFWHVSSWQELGRFKTPLAAINDLTFANSGGTLAIGGRADDNTGQVVLWETKPIGD
jgi:WD40 repeat protein